MYHFREALRLEPNNEWARAGIVESLKASHFIYRIFLGYIFWMSRLSGRVQWMLILGAYVLIQVVARIADSSPTLEPWLTPVVWLYVGFVVLTWLSVPLFNLLLRLNRFGRLALSPEQTWGANLLGGGLLLFACVAAAALIVGGPRLETATIRTGLFLLPLSGVYLVSAGKPRWVMGAIASAVALFGMVSVLPGMTVERADGLYGTRLALGCGQLFNFGVLGSTILANVLGGREE